MPSVNDGFSYSDFTNKQDFTNKINGKGQPSGYVLTTNGTKSYWAAGGGGGQGIQGRQGPMGSKGNTGNTGVQGIQGISGGGNVNYYYQNRYNNLEYYQEPIDINSVHDDACGLDYIDEFEPTKGEWEGHEYRDVTLTPVTTTDNNGKMVVDERSPFAFGTAHTEGYINSGYLDGIELGEAGWCIPALYWRPNAMSRSYTYYKDGETGGGGLGSYSSHGSADIRSYGANFNDVFGGFPFVLGIDLDWTDSGNDFGRNFRRASQTDHYLLIDNNDGCGGDAVSLLCTKIFIKDVIQAPEQINLPWASGMTYNFIMDPYKNVRFSAMDNAFTVRAGGHTLLHLCIRRFPNLNPTGDIYDSPYYDDYIEMGGNPDEHRDADPVCDTLFVSLDWTHYDCNPSALSDTIINYKPEDESYFCQGALKINGSFYYIE